MKIEMFLLLIMVTFASERKENDADNLILVKIEEDESTKVQKTSQYIGMSHSKEKTPSWRASRRSKNEKKMVYNGTYKNEETAAHESDTLAKNLMKNGEQNHKLNFLDDNTEVYAKEEKTSEYVGVSYCESKACWRASRGSKNEKETVHNGRYKDEETAAHASDTLAKKLMENGEQNHKLNFPDDDTEVNPEKKKLSSKYIGVTYLNRNKKWSAQRWSTNESKQLYNGSYKDEETAAHASDTLAKKLMENGEQNHKLNFPDDDTESQTNKRKRSENEDLGHSKNK